MSKRNKFIPNPNKISNIEKDFINDEKEIEDKKIDLKKGRMISMSDSFYKKLNDFLRKNPTEGSRSSLIVRVVSDYIDKK